MSRAVGRVGPDLVSFFGSRVARAGSLRTALLLAMQPTVPRTGSLRVLSRQARLSWLLALEGASRSCVVTTGLCRHGRCCRRWSPSAGAQTVCGQETVPAPPCRQGPLAATRAQHRQAAQGPQEEGAAQRAQLLKKGEGARGLWATLQRQRRDAQAPQQAPQQAPRAHCLVLAPTQPRCRLTSLQEHHAQRR